MLSRNSGGPLAPDVWDDGAAYEPYVGRWSRLVAGRFLEWLAIPPRSAWLDCGCGTGALSETVLAAADPRVIVGCDRSSGYTAFARGHILDDRARFVVAELPDLPRISDGFDAVVAGLVFNFLPDPVNGLAAMATRAREGGTVAGYVWDYADGMQMMRAFWDAAVALDPAAAPLDEGQRRAQLRDAIRQRLPVAADGTITLSARAWAVRGIAP